MKRKQIILNSCEWGSDLEVQLLAIELKRDIVVLTSARDGGSYAHRFPYEPPPIPKMQGGIFIPISTNELREQWISINLHPFTVIKAQNNKVYNSLIMLVLE